MNAKFNQYFIERIKTELQNLEEIGGPETLKDYVTVLEAVHLDVQNRLVSAHAQLGTKYPDAGTPKSLDAVISIALCVGPMSQLRFRLYHGIRDFLAQRFGAAILGTENGDCLQRLENLFQSITKRE